MITQEDLKSRFFYDPETGLFTSKTPRGRYNRWPAGHVIKSTEATGYVVFRVNGKTVKAHRMAFLYMTGSIPKEIDHKNGIRHDNRWSNLRPATRAQQAMNRSVSKNNISGVSGVTWNSEHAKWAARLRKDGKMIWLGYFDNIEEAAQKRIEAEKEHYCSFSRLESVAV